ncbi:hypothetical protein [uncultured Sphingomonas sp.]|uniref:hypothetical protein n=1 Tax=uncultured Sphingomonas sp. TaxID=158754 RepID=UPI0025F7E66A|nr:hypothetical protein [uncultured Sphingomonas sp.]
MTLNDTTATIFVGQDAAGRWLVQDGTGGIGGRFTSERAAIRFARDEAEIHHLAVAIAPQPLVALA